VLGAKFIDHTNYRHFQESISHKLLVVFLNGRENIGLWSWCELLPGARVCVELLICKCILPCEFSSSSLRCSQ